MRANIASVLFILGIVLIIAAAAWISYPLGIGVAGIAFVLIAVLYRSEGR